jgi:FkbM family methyltransferase
MAAHTFLNRLRRTRRWANQILGRDVRTPIQVKCRREFLGSEYGGWCICPDRITPDSLVCSFGVGQDISWDLAMIERFGVHVHAFDPTPKAIAWIKSQSLPQRFHFYEFGIAAYDGTARFALPRPDHVSYSMNNALGEENQPAVDIVEAPVRRLTTLLKMAGHDTRDRVDILKMDVEGAEIEVIENFPSLGVEVDQLLIEFHHHVGHAKEVARTQHALDVINQFGFKLFYNSPVGKEFAFLRVR